MPPITSIAEAEEPTRSQEPDWPIDSHKASVVDYALYNFPIESLVDLGACWGVHGGYTFHALEVCDLERAVIVDGNVTAPTREQAEHIPRVELIQGPLGAHETVDRVGRVDAAIMFDILLHQVDPNWNDVLARYASNVDTLIIHNQCWRGPETVRFPDFDVEQYIDRVESHSPERIREWYQRHDEFNVDQQKPWRDVHNYWQWGITAKDLVGTLWDLGYAIEAFENTGAWSEQLSEIEMLSIVAHKRNPTR